MAVIDPIADLLTRIRNAMRAGHADVTISSSKMKIAILEIMKSKGFIQSFTKIEDNKQGELNIKLRYTKDGKSLIEGLKRVSRFGRRYYVNKDRIPTIQGGLGVAILSTSKGVLSNEKARELGVGGEVICYIW